VLNGIFWRLRTGAPWADIPERYGPYTTCVNRFNRWRKAGVWDRLLEAVSKAYDGDCQRRSKDASAFRSKTTSAMLAKKPPNREPFSSSVRVGQDYPPVCPSLPVVSDACFG
jgi:transposase